MKIKPYVGITGFMSRKEAISSLAVWENLGITNRLLAIGVLVSWKTLNGYSASNPNRYPDVGEIREIFRKHPHVLNLIHYNSKYEDGLSDQLVELTEFGGRKCHGLQLNIAWPPAFELLKWREKFPKLRLVLQISREVQEEIKGDLRMLAARICEYGESITDVLIDPSQGRGEKINVEKAQEALSIIRDVCNEEAEMGIGFGVAGGLHGGNLRELKSLMREFPNLSIDAESMLRDGRDNLDRGLAKYYLQGAGKVFQAT